MDNNIIFDGDMWLAGAIMMEYLPVDSGTWASNVVRKVLGPIVESGIIRLIIMALS